MYFNTFAYISEIWNFVQMLFRCHEHGAQSLFSHVLESSSFKISHAITSFLMKSVTR